MPNINTYPVLESVSGADTMIGTRASDGVTVQIPVDLVAGYVYSNTIEVTLSNASTYQNDLLIGKTTGQISPFISGSEGFTSAVVTNFNSTTGTLTFVAPITGDVKIFVAP